MKDDKLWRWFSIYIRLRDADKKGICTCITCGAKHPWKGTSQINAGHFMSRSHNSTKYDENNVWAQCVSCNKYGHGKAFEFGAYIDYKLGAGSASRLYQKSKMFARALNKSEIDHYTEIYKNKAKELSIKKGLPI